jgi:hypothetical protein
MRSYRDAAALRSALEGKLRASGDDPYRLARMIVIERLLARLLQVESEIVIVLKGGSALEARLGSRLAQLKTSISIR